MTLSPGHLSASSIGALCRSATLATSASPSPLPGVLRLGFQPVEAPEHVLVLRFWYPGPIVKDIDD